MTSRCNLTSFYKPYWYQNNWRCNLTSIKIIDVAVWRVFPNATYQNNWRCNLTSFSKRFWYQNNWLNNYFSDTFSYMRGCPDSSRDLVQIWWACFQVEPFIFGLIRQLKWKSTLPYPKPTETLLLFMSHLQLVPVINLWILSLQNTN